MPIEVIYADRRSQAASAKAEGDNLWLSAAELAKVSGWELKPEGVCKGGVCVPIPAGRESDFVRDNRQAFNLASFARLMGQPMLHDDKHDIWYFGQDAGSRSAALKSLDTLLLFFQQLHRERIGNGRLRILGLDAQAPQ